MLQPYIALNSTLNTKKAISINSLISQSNLQRILTKEKAITTKLKLRSYFSTISGQFKNIRPTVEITSALLNNTCLIQTCKAFIIIVSHSTCSVLKLSSLQGLWHIDIVFFINSFQFSYLYILPRTVIHFIIIAMVIVKKTSVTSSYINLFGELKFNLNTTVCFCFFSWRSRGVGQGGIQSES